MANRFVAYIHQQCGEYEFRTTILLTAANEKEAEELLDGLCQSWFDDTDIDYTDATYYFNCGEVAVRPGTVSIIEESVFIALKNSTHLLELSL